MAYQIRRKSFRQKLKGPDEFISTTQKYLLFAKENAKAVIIGISAVIIIAILTGVLMKRLSANKEAYYNQVYDDVLLANSKFSDGELEEAEVIFSRIREDEKSGLFNEVAEIGLGRIFMARKEYDKGTKIFEDLIARENVTYPKEELYRNLAINYEETGKKEKAAETYSKLMTLYPESTDISIYKRKSATQTPIPHP